MEKYILNMAGEYRVCSEILKRGYFSTVTMGNLKGADIHIITKERTVIVVEVKSTQSNRFVTGFFQKYKTQDTPHPDFWVLCQLNDRQDRFFVLSHQEMADSQALANKFDAGFEWENVHDVCKKGVDNLKIENIEKYENKWEKIDAVA